jgi:hypothetical protein
MNKATILAACVLFGAVSGNALQASPGPSHSGVIQGEDGPGNSGLNQTQAATMLETLGPDYPGLQAISALSALEETLAKDGYVPVEVQAALRKHGEIWLSAYGQELEGDGFDSLFEEAMSEQQIQENSLNQNFKAVAQKIQALELATTRLNMAQALMRHGSGFRTTTSRTGRVGLDKRQAADVARRYAALKTEILAQASEIRAVLQQG